EHGGLHRTATRDDADALPFAHAVAFSVFPGKADCGAVAMQRRREAARLHAGVERLEAPSGREPDREILGELVDRRVVLDRLERSTHRHLRLPEPPMEELLPGMLLVPAGPLDPPELFEPRVAHPGVYGRQSAQLVPDVHGG